MSIEGLFFDFDGVIADTETCWVETIEEYCAAQKRPIDRKMLDLCLGDGDVGMLEYLSRCTGSTPEQLLDALRPRFREKTARLTLRPGIAAGICYAQEHALRLALVSNSTQSYLDGWLKKLGLENVFSCVVARTPQIPGKPAPDLYLLALQKTGLCPERTIAVEDSVLGLRAACAAGICAVAYPNEATRKAVADTFGLCVDLGMVSPQVWIRQTEEFYRQQSAG